MEKLLLCIEKLIWGCPLLLLLLGTGLLLLLRLRFAPILALPRALRMVCSRRKGNKSGVSPFGALCTALSAAVGTGNIVGVASALSIGGPGALLWMELSALFGLSLRYAEGWLSVRYRLTRADGSCWGGPFCYIRQGLGERWSWLAKLFAFCCAAAGVCGAGTFVQVGSVSACLRELLNRVVPEIVSFCPDRAALISACVGAFAVLTAAAAARILCKGMKGISRASAVLVPVMGSVYALFCLWVLIRQREALPGALLSVLKGAFRPAAVHGGLLGTVTAGVSRGLFSNEAGLGTAPIASAAAEGVSPEEQGLISMTAIVFDTFFLCTLTGLVLLVTGTERCGIGAAIAAFSRGLPISAPGTELLVLVILMLFAFTTVVGWSCFGTASLEYLCGENRALKKIYLIAYLGTVLIAPWCSAQSIWVIANIWNGLMAIPNLIALCLLSGRIGRPAGSLRRRSARSLRRRSSVS